MVARLKKAQTTAEYAILIGLVIGAVLAMQTYVRRGINARIKDVVDASITPSQQPDGVTFSFNTQQYEPGFAVSSSARSQYAKDQEKLEKDGLVKRASSETTGQTRHQKVSWDEAVTALTEVQAPQIGNDKRDLPTLPQ
jgi:hypothetical protein